LSSTILKKLNNKIMKKQEEQKVMLSFVTPNFNDGKTIERQVDSIMDQDYKYIEQIIVDDGSTDGSKKILDKLAKKYKGRLKVIYLPKNEGACTARNIGAAEAKGKYLSFLPADAKLYPGVARIWVETLEDNPQYDFLYGGYKFTDDNYNEIYNYMGDDFDPYFLKITNYIDGSYPLKKELFDKMGGWDPQIKSLQDWDLWLNAVINHNAKGLYRKEVFFETTMPHPGGLSADSHNNWLERVGQIKKKYNIPQKRICVTGQGASFHAKNVAKLIGADYMYDPSFKPHKYDMIYVVGFFGNVAQAFKNTRAMRVVHWIGSDILHIKNSKPEELQWIIKWLDNNVDVHLCEFETTRKELEEMGIKARIVPFPPEVMYNPLPLPEKPAVACYLPYNNKAFYMPDIMMEVAKKMKDVDFYFFGDPTMWGKKGNITHLGSIKLLEKDKVIQNTSMIVRLTPHDGLPLSVIEWLTAGREAITTVDVKYANKIGLNFKYTGDAKKDKKINEQNVKLVIDKIKKILSNQKINKKASDYYHELCSPEKFKKTINGFLDFKMSEWWEKMSSVWEGVEASKETTEDIVAILKEFKKLKPESVLDIGCGTGRWSDLLDIDNYYGIDFSKTLIEKAKKNHPDRDFKQTDILKFNTNKKFDVVFSFASLLHVRPEDIKDYVEHIKTLGKYAILVEPVRDADVSSTSERVVHPKIIELQKKSDFVFNVKYTWIHDYMNLFNVERIVPMSNNRQMFIINLEK
jgi:glycosyltransferase involved in cell wall biosynthesis/protein-L-isoaspartate O-methyltransferase